MSKRKSISAYTDGDTFEHNGRTLRVRLQQDYNREPWKEYDGHGVVLDWQTRLSEKEARARGYWELNSERSSVRYYDARASLARAIKDGWGPGKSVSAKRRAVRRDFEHLRGWCTDQWCYVIVSVETEDGEEFESNGGVESNDCQTIELLVNELAEELCKRLGTVSKPYNLREHNETT